MPCAIRTVDPRLLIVVSIVVRIDRLARGKVVDVEVVVLGAPVFVSIVEASDRTFFDRAARAAFVLALRLALSLGRRIGTEVAAARSAATWLGRTRREASGPWTAKPAGGTRPTRPRSAETARTRACGPFFAWPRFTHRERTSFEGLLVEASDRFFGDSSIRVIDERESARTTGFPINRKDDLGWIADARQMLPQICLVCRIRQIAYKQTD